MRILLYAYTYPPMPSVGSNRWASLVPYLQEAGHIVKVVTTDAFGAAPGDGESDVVRARDLTGSPALRRVLRRPRLEELGAPGATNQPAPGPMMRVVVPDPWLLSWTLPSLPTLRRVVAEWRPDCLVSTSPYESVHLGPLLLGPGRPPWIAEFRDGWCFEPHRPPFPTRPQRSLDRWIERRVMSAADVVVGATFPIVADARSRLGVDARYIPNGWDPRLEPGAVDEPARTAPGKRSLVYTGSLTGSGDRDPSGLVDALAKLRRDDPGIADRLELVIAGHPNPEDRPLIERAGIEDMVRHLGLLPRSAAIALQREADALVLVTSISGSEAPAKLYEYMAAKTPILALTGASEAARLVRATGTGEVHGVRSVDQIAAAIGRIVDGSGLSYRPDGLDAYVYPVPAEQMVEACAAAVSRRSPVA